MTGPRTPGTGGRINAGLMPTIPTGRRGYIGLTIAGYTLGYRGIPAHIKSRYYASLLEQDFLQPAVSYAFIVQLSRYIIKYEEYLIAVTTQNNQFEYSQYRQGKTHQLNIKPEVYQREKTRFWKDKTRLRVSLPSVPQHKRSFLRLSNAPIWTI